MIHEDWKIIIYFFPRYINFLASVLATDKPQNERARDSNRKVVVHSSKGKIYNNSIDQVKS